MKVPFGLDKATNRFVGIDEVKNGLACGCICPSCKMRLKARQGKDNEHHFSHHHPKNSQRAKTKCEYSYWVSVRSMAKQLIIENKCLSFNSHIQNNHSFFPISFFSIKSEPRVKDYQFDLKIETSIGSIYVYFLTNAEDTGRERKHYIDNPKYFNDKLILEIDISTIRETKKDALSELKILLFQRQENKVFLTPSISFVNQNSTNHSNEKEIEKKYENSDLKVLKHIPFDILDKAKYFYINQFNHFKNNTNRFNGEFETLDSNNKDLFFITYQGYFCCFTLYKRYYYALSLEDAEIVPYPIKKRSFFETQKRYIELIDKKILGYF